VLDGPGIEAWWRRDFPHLSRPVPRGPPRLLYGVSLSDYSGRSVALATHPPSIAEVKERVELYLYSPSVPLWPVIG